LRELVLHNNQLSGEIPPEIGTLSALTGLYLGSNQLSGEIPPEIGDLTALGNLYLDSNQLSGPISRRRSVTSPRWSGLDCTTTN